MRNQISKEPIRSPNMFFSLITWLKNKLNKLPVIVAGPALAFGMVFVLIEPTDKINVVVESEVPKIMDSYCQLHENGTGGAALC